MKVKLDNVDLEVYGVIYCIINKVNNKVYIGQTTRGFNKRYGNKGIEDVYKQHEYRKGKNLRYNKHLLRSIEKYGFDNFEINEVVDFAFSKSELDIKEICWISIYDSYNNGYNNTLGGDRPPVSKGSDVHTNKYSENQIIEDKKLLSENKLKHKQIEMITNVDSRTIGAISSGRVWKDVGTKYNAVINENYNIHVYRINFFNDIINIKICEEEYYKGTNAKELTLRLNLVDSIKTESNILSGKCREMRKLFRYFEYRDKGLVKFCEICGELIICKNKISYSRRKYCNKCGKYMKNESNKRLKNY